MLLLQATAGQSSGASGPLAPGVRASPGTVGYLGDGSDLTVLNYGDSFVGTSLEGVATWSDGVVLRINASDFTMEDYHLTDSMVLHASGANLTIRNCVIDAPQGGFYAISQNGAGQGNMTVEDTTITCAAGPGTARYSAAILCQAGTFVGRRLDVSGSGDGIHFCGIPGTDFDDPAVPILSQSYIHDLSFLDSSQHLDSIQIYNTTASNTTTDTLAIVEHNYVPADDIGPLGEGANAAVTMGKPSGDNTGPFMAAKIDNNYFGGGAYHLRIGYRMQNTVVTNNNLGSVNEATGEFGLVSVDLSGSVTTWSNNRDGSGAAGTGTIVNNPTP